MAFSGRQHPAWRHLHSPRDADDDDSDDATEQATLDAVPFVAASWSTTPWQGWPDGEVKAWMPNLDSFIAKRISEMASDHLESRLSRLKVDSIYTAIDRPNTIRLFELLPASSRQTGLSGKLHEADLEFTWPRNDNDIDSAYCMHVRPKRMTNFAISLATLEPVCYTALSYHWGPPRFDRAITIGGVEKPITTALYQALVHLRHRNHSVLLWVDQICINQSDLADKEFQIRLMAKVYTHAWNTAIWVPTKSDQGVFKALRNIHDATRHLDDVRMLDLIIERLLYPHAQEDHDALMDVGSLLSQPWFKRTWVIQEACLSQYPLVVTGHTTIDWVDLSAWCSSALRLVSSNRERASGPKPESLEEKLPAGSLEVLSELGTVKDYLRTGETPKLFDTLIKTRYAQVTDPLDKVYGVLGICESRIEPDYSRSPPSLFYSVAVETVRRSMLEGGNRGDCFRLLCCVDHEPTAGLPSWAVDWSKPRVTTSIGLGALVWSGPSAGGRLGPNDSMPATFSLDVNRRTLHLPVQIFATVQNLSNLFTTAELFADDCQVHNSSLMDAFAFTISGSDNIPSNLFMLFCETVMGGTGNLGLKRNGAGVVIEVLSLLLDETTGAQPSMPGQTYSLRQKEGHFTAANLKNAWDGRTFRVVQRAYRSAMFNRRLCWSDRGHLGLVPRHAQAGDLLCVVHGFIMPFVVRKRDDWGYMLVGECYLHDVMHGEVLQDPRIPVEEVTLR